jgi:oxazoline/thiazoline dehydrogenase
LKPPGGSIRTIPLPRPDLGWLSLNDITLTTAIEKRRSVRTHGAIPISLDELGHFLYRTARVRGFHNIPGAEFTSRPYANGGAGYELELYLCIDRCLELDRGFYYYEPEGHSLLLKRYANPDLERALDEAWLASAETCRPQVLIMIASRFKRVSWKYRGIAYATQLKNCGVLYANMYLVAESMNLAACALGLGNPTRFACLAGCDFYSEGTVGEFMLGTRAWGA